MDSTPVCCFPRHYIHHGGVSSDICMRFGRRLRTLRERKGWTQVYMAEHIGMDRSYISDLECGKKGNLPSHT